MRNWTFDKSRTAVNSFFAGCLIWWIHVLWAFRPATPIVARAGQKGKRTAWNGKHKLGVFDRHKQGRPEEARRILTESNGELGWKNPLELAEHLQWEARREGLELCIWAMARCGLGKL
jgi:hypothetical protein